MLLINYFKKFQANKLVNNQIQGGIWEDPIATMAELRSIRVVATLNDDDEDKMESAKKTAKYKQMAVEFLLGGRNTFIPRK